MKLVFYAVVAILAAVFLWRNRHALAQAVRDILRQLRELLATALRRPTDSLGSERREALPNRRFAIARSPSSAIPSATGDHRRLAPEELVRYTFEAFEAWARDAGHPRSPDQTPAELVRWPSNRKRRSTKQAHRMTRLYSEVAYAPGRISPAAAESLRELWSLMQANSRPAGRHASIRWLTARLVVRAGIRYHPRPASVLPVRSLLRFG